MRGFLLGLTYYNGFVIHNVCVIIKRSINYKKMAYWAVEFWENSDGTCRVEKDLLKKIRLKEPFLFESLGDKIGHYVSVPIENAKDLKYIQKVKNEESMWELKFHLSKNEIRLLGCIVSNNKFPIFYVLYGFKKKDQGIRGQNMDTARVRVREFLNQYKQNGLQEIL